MPIEATTSFPHTISLLLLRKFLLIRWEKLWLHYCQTLRKKKGNAISMGLFSRKNDKSIQFYLRHTFLTMKALFPSQSWWIHFGAIWKTSRDAILGAYRCVSTNYTILQCTRVASKKVEQVHKRGQKTTLFFAYIWSKCINTSNFITSVYCTYPIRHYSSFILPLLNTLYDGSSIMPTVFENQPKCRM